MKIGLIGFGNVGKALVELLSETTKDIEIIYIVKSNGALLDENGLDLKSVVVMEDHIYNHPSWSSQLNVQNLSHIDVDTVVELTPVDRVNGEPAYTYMKQAIMHHRNVVTGNKGPIVKYYKELTDLAAKNGVKLGISCCAGGALPSLETGIYGVAGSKILSIEGVLNGTTNYILDEMTKHKISYEDALKEAIRLGIAEANPENDVEGYDTALKMIIIANTVLNTKMYLTDVAIEGITKITQEMIIKAIESGKRYRLIARAFYEKGQVKISVAPELVDENSPFYNISGSNKAVCYHTDHLGDIVISGGESTPISAAAAILRDVTNLIY